MLVSESRVRLDKLFYAIRRSGGRSNIPRGDKGGIGFYRADPNDGSKSYVQTVGTERNEEHVYRWPSDPERWDTAELILENDCMSWYKYKVVKVDPILRLYLLPRNLLHQ